MRAPGSVRGRRDPWKISGLQGNPLLYSYQVERMPTYSEGGIMKIEAAGSKWLFLSILIVAGLTGCTTNISPPSGPSETRVCFNPAPPTGFGGQLDRCGWFVELQRDGERRWSRYTENQCFTIPSLTFFPGEEISVEVTGDWGQTGFKCGFQKVELPELLFLYQYYGTFLVTE
jgi:hypothetical protein